MLELMGKDKGKPGKSNKKGDDGGGCGPAYSMHCSPCNCNSDKDSAGLYATQDHVHAGRRTRS